MIKLGQKVKDTITGLEGIVVAKTKWLHGCVRITIQPKVGEDGKVPDNYSFDEPQAEIIEDTPEKKPKKKKFGDRPSPSQKLGPIR